MEILLAACLLAWTAGARSERAALGISPAQRELIKEQVRHDKTVRKIAEKHGAAPPAAPGAPAPAGPAAPGAAAPAPVPLTIPEAFRAGYRGHTPIARVATPMGRRAGGWAARGVAWGKDTGRSALREYRKRRQAAGAPDPAPVIVPPMPTHPPTAGSTTPPGAPPMLTTPPTAGSAPAATVPPMPTQPPTAGTQPPAAPGPSDPPAAGDTAPDADGSTPEAAEEAPDGAVEPPVVPEGSMESPEAEQAREGASEARTIVLPAPRPAEPPEPAAGPEPAADSRPAPAPEPPGDGGSKTTIEDPGGVGRMAAEVSYDSVMEESDELSLMCDDDVKVYGRIRQRCEREIGRADDLVAQLGHVGAGPTVIGWVTRCREQYQVLLGQLDELERNTISQGEAVVKAKALLEAGQGYYADIAADMESVAERDFYISDQVDGEDASAHSETYETQGARA
ncbi:hypothetical protein ACFWG0_27620 [Streptomyces yangpuensis]|uniref:hypothetical protein n=1 Tax=Streptomyces yangpuensis TaxID=1648182 RepID=UPI00364EF266